ncbi:MAG: hypothetical protein AAFY27_10695 [Pseudomonadota bacterium]
MIAQRPFGPLASIHRRRYSAFGDAHHVLSTLLAGHGVALLPNELTVGLRTGGALRKLFNAMIEPDAGYFAITNPHSAHAKAHAGLVEWLRHAL